MCNNPWSHKMMVWNTCAYSTSSYADRETHTFITASPPVPPPPSSLFFCWCVSRRVTPGCSSRPRVSPPGRPHRFHKPSPAQTTPGKSMMSLGHLTKGASWEELIQACLQSFGKSISPYWPAFALVLSLMGWDTAVKCAAGVCGPCLCNTQTSRFCGIKKKKIKKKVWLMLFCSTPLCYWETIR